MCKTHKCTAGLGHDCIGPKAILQLPVELRVRFIDLLMAFEAKSVVLGPNRPHGCSIACAFPLTQAAGEKLGERPRCSWGCQGKSCDRAAWAHSIMVAAAKRHSTNTWGMIISWRRAIKQASQGDCWRVGALLLRRLAVPRSRQVCHVPFPGLRDHSPRLQRRHHSCKTHAGNSSGNGVISQHTGSGMSSTTFRDTWPGPPGRFRFSLHKQPGPWRASRCEEYTSKYRQFYAIWLRRKRQQQYEQ